MEGLDRGTGFAEAGADLEKAAGVGGDDNLRAGFDDVGDFALLQAFGPLGVVAEQLAVFLERRTATGGIDHDCWKIMSLEDFDVMPGAIAGEFKLAAVRIQRAATTLLWRGDDFVTGAIEQAHAGGI